MHSAKEPPWLNALAVYALFGWFSSVPMMVIGFKYEIRPLGLTGAVLIAAWLVCCIVALVLAVAECRKQRPRCGQET